MKRLVLFALLAGAGSGRADEVFLSSGGRLSGIVVERSAKMVVIDVGAGRVSLPAERVVRIVEGAAPLGIYRERAAALAPLDTQGWLNLAVWAQERDLPTQARDAFQRVRALDPENALAQQALGNVRLGDRWVTPEESFRAQGLVLFEGRWVSPAERAGILEEQAAEQAALRAAQERAAAEARAREAEARAAEAEARAAEARANAEAGGIPFGYVGGYGGAYGVGYGVGMAFPHVSHYPRSQSQHLVMRVPSSTPRGGIFSRPSPAASSPTQRAQRRN